MGFKIKTVSDATLQQMREGERQSDVDCHLIASELLRLRKIKARYDAIEHFMGAWNLSDDHSDITLRVLRAIFDVQVPERSVAPVEVPEQSVQPASEARGISRSGAYTNVTLTTLLQLINEIQLDSHTKPDEEIIVLQLGVGAAMPLRRVHRDFYSGHTAWYLIG